MACAPPYGRIARSGTRTHRCPTTATTETGAKVSEGVRDEYWRQGMATGILAAYRAIRAFSETDFREDLKKVTVPTLILHGSDDPDRSHRDLR